MEEEPFQSESQSEEQIPSQEQPPTQQTTTSQQQPPQHQPQHTPSKKPSKPFIEKLASDKMLSMIVVLGLLVIMLGAVIISAAPFSTNYSAEEEFGDAGDEEDDGLTTREKYDREVRERNMEYTGNILTNIGLFILASGVLLGVFLRDDWNKWIRIALAGFALVIIIFAWFGGEFILGVGIS